MSLCNAGPLNIAATITPNDQLDADRRDADAEAEITALGPRSGDQSIEQVFGYVQESAAGMRTFNR